MKVYKIVFIAIIAVYLSACATVRKDIIKNEKAAAAEEMIKNLKLIRIEPGMMLSSLEKRIGIPISKCAAKPTANLSCFSGIQALQEYIPNSFSGIFNAETILGPGIRKVHLKAEEQAKKYKVVSVDINTVRPLGTPDYFVFLYGVFTEGRKGIKFAQKMLFYDGRLEKIFEAKWDKIDERIRRRIIGIMPMDALKIGAKYGM